ncbi:hypothetical protein P8917_03225 [Bacillus atrophaeus]|uniref:hypothetical protein n=1 Tax=Bacillus atrophaeus TaxID=1452 RepID=UPI002281BD0A|nr:hypothetical protein [Bacillus atrophaeus]MCY8497671.1 hypothetical protein [Bacillus atrophaeus]MCY8811042.1 hypothetical protein [Bacillus atrophaeus]MCY8821485.1 hypothetical protein [Bacillus atrophaeus]MCY8829183.1 hypothetical protein [Bacillus atrophaeus]MCY8834390.1 hypothetical protein [Bacillus atrophaeus]
MKDILTNPLVIAAVIGIISAIFGKKNKDQKPVKRPQQPQPVKAQTVSEEKQPVEAQIPDQSAENKFQTMRTQAEQRRRETEQTLKGLEQELQVKKRNTSYTKQKVLQMNKDTVVQGIVLGEVFGPPRAKKPHHTMRETHKK